MATYNIAPATTGSEIGMGQMRYGLSASANYNASNIYSVGSTDMQTLVSNSITYQPDLDSKTWNTSTPYGFAEMAGQTWSTAVTYSIFYSFSDSALGVTGESYTIKANGVTLVNYTGTSPSTGTVSAAVGATIEVLGSGNASTAAGLEGRYRQPAGSGGYTSLFTDTAGGGGGTLTGNGSFVLGSNDADVEIFFS